MDNSSSPEGTPPAQATPVAAQPATSSSTVQSDFNSRVQSASSLAEIRKLRSELPKKVAAPPPPAPVPASPAPAAAEETPAATPEATTTEPSEATPEPVASDQPEQAATPEQPDAETEDTDEGEGPVSPVTGKRIHLRVNDADEVGKLALAFQKRNRDWSLKQAIEAAEKQLGIAPQQTEKPAETAPSGPQMPKTVQETDTVVAQKLADYKKAMAEVRFEDAADLQVELMKLNLHRSSLERSVEREQQQAAAKYDADFTASEAKAVDLYPFAADAASPGYKRIQEIYATLKATEDPLIHSPNMPLKLAQMVAAELNIAPKSKNATPAKPAAAPATPAPKKGVVPSGSSRTTPPPPKPAIDPAISGIKTLADLRKAKLSVGLRV